MPELRPGAGERHDHPALEVLREPPDRLSDFVADDVGLSEGARGGVGYDGDLVLGHEAELEGELVDLGRGDGEKTLRQGFAADGVVELHATGGDGPPLVAFHLDLAPSVRRRRHGEADCKKRGNAESHPTPPCRSRQPRTRSPNAIIPPGSPARLCSGTPAGYTAARRFRAGRHQYEKNDRRMSRNPAMSGSCRSSRRSCGRMLQTRQK